jgi:hypothetical protein
MGISPFPDLSVRFNMARAWIRCHKSTLSQKKHSAPTLAIATKHVVLVAIEAALSIECFLQTAASAMDLNLGCGQRATSDLGDLCGGLSLEIVEHQSRPVVLRQAVDDLSHAAVHLVNDEPLINLRVGDMGSPRLVDFDHPRPALWPAEMVGRDSCGYGERPGLDAGSPFELGQTARYLEQRVLKKIVGSSTVADQPFQIPSKRI